MSVLTKEGFAALRFAYLVFVVGIGVAVFLVGGSYIYWQAEKSNNVRSQKSLNDMQSRLANAKRERDDLRNSEDTYQALTARGIFLTEARLDLLDAMQALKNRHQIVSLEYQISEQRPLTLAGGTTLAAVNALGSRIRLKASAVHDGDMVAFLDEFPRLQRGLFPIDRCVIKRSLGSAETGVAQAQRQLTARLRANNADDAGDNDNVQASIAQTVVPAVDFDCSLEWITLLDKRAQADTKVAAVAGVGK